MKKITSIVALLLVAVTALFMVSCSSYGKIQKAFEKEGYEVIEDFETSQKAIVEKLKGEGEKSSLNLHVLHKGLIDVVFVVEFKATKDLVNFYKENDYVKTMVKDVKDNEDVQAMYDALEEAGIVNGNCLVFTINPLAISSVANIVKNA